VKDAPTLVPGIEHLRLAVAKTFVRSWHYSDMFPPHCLLNLGARDAEGRLAAVGMWGFGVRPMHTIRALFPLLTTRDYLELARLCLRDDMPRNSESMFLSWSAAWIHERLPRIKLLFSWADGIRGKPGYVYQAASWLYGGYIKTQVYANADHESVHPRLLITRYGTRTKEFCKSIGLVKWEGYQFRYVKFLCGHKEMKRLLRESTVKWTQEYPKKDDCRWWNNAGEVSRETREPPRLEGTGQFRHPAPSSESRDAPAATGASRGAKK